MYAIARRLIARWLKGKYKSYLIPMDIKTIFGLTLKQVRKEKGISQEKLAYKGDMDRAHMSSLERGLSNPRLETLFRICEILEISPEDFIRRMTDKMSPS